MRTEDTNEDAPAFVVIRAGETLRVEELRRGVPTTVGSVPEADIATPGNGGPTSVRLTWRGTGVLLEPGAGPLHVNGKPCLETAELAPGDEIALDTVQLVIGVPAAIRAIGRRTLTHHEFRERTYEELARARRGSRPTALVMVSLPPGVGRGVGDDALASLRAGDLMGIYAPDVLEFLLPDTSAEIAQMVFERMLGTLLDTLKGVHIGVAATPHDADHAERLLWASEQAMCEAAVAGELFARPPEGPALTDPSDTLKQVIAEVPETGNVLIVGEVSTGRSLVARALRQGAPSNAVVACGALAEDDDLVELLAAGDGGTVVLEEIGDLPPETHEALSSALDGLAPETRVVSTSQRAIAGLVERGAFDAQLFERLNAHTVELPPLRTRTQDILPLATRFATEAGGQQPRWSAGAVARLRSYSWPANVLELKNAMRRAVRLAGRRGELLGEHLPSEPTPITSTPGRLREHVDGVERDAIIKALADCNHNQTHAAKRLGISRRALIYKMEKYGLKRPPKGRTA